MMNLSEQSNEGSESNELLAMGWQTFAQSPDRLAHIEKTLFDACSSAQKSGRLDAEVVGALDSLAGAYCVLRRYDDALRVYRYGIELKQKLYGADHPKLADALHDLATVLRQTGDAFEARSNDFRSHALKAKKSGYGPG